jgi:Spy/CpxP family protein refolding chaperone
MADEWRAKFFPKYFAAKRPDSSGIHVRFAKDQPCATSAPFSKPQSPLLMTKQLLLLALALGSATCIMIAQDGKRPPQPPPNDASRNPAPRLLPRGAEESLNLTPDQRKQLDDLTADVQAKLKTILTPEQQEKLATLRPPPQSREGRDGNRPQRGPGDNKPAARSTATSTLALEPSAPVAASTQPLAPGVKRLPVVFANGHDTVPVDHGRPVILIASALGVAPEVFREAFSHVHPAGPGRGGPTDAEARANKTALMNALGKYGITDERLNTVSNFYRYAAWEGGIWKNKPATANALVKDGAVIGYELTSGGYGYTTAPSISVPELPSAAARVEIGFSKEFETNGAVTAISVGQNQ